MNTIIIHPVHFKKCIFWQCRHRQEINRRLVRLTNIEDQNFFMKFVDNYIIWSLHHLMEKCNMEKGRKLLKLWRKITRGSIETWSILTSRNLDQRTKAPLKSKDVASGALLVIVSTKKVSTAITVSIDIVIGYSKGLTDLWKRRSNIKERW